MARSDKTRLTESVSVSKSSNGEEPQSEIVVRREAGPVTATIIVCSEDHNYGSENYPNMRQCGAIVDVVENDDGLVAQILEKKVPERSKETYYCRRGHNGKLEVFR